MGRVNNAAALGSATHVAAIDGRAIEVAEIVHDHSTKWICPVRASGKSVNHRFRPARSYFEYHTVPRSAYTAIGRSAVNITRGVDGDRSPRVSPVRAASESVQHGFLPLGSDFKYGAAPTRAVGATTTVQCRAVQITCLVSNHRAFGITSIRAALELIQSGEKIPIQFKGEYRPSVCGSACGGRAVDMVVGIRALLACGQTGAREFTIRAKKYAGLSPLQPASLCIARRNLAMNRLCFRHRLSRHIGCTTRRVPDHPQELLRHPTRP